MTQKKIKASSPGRKLQSSSAKRAVLAPVPKKQNPKLVSKAKVAYKLKEPKLISYTDIFHRICDDIAMRYGIDSDFSQA